MARAPSSLRVVENDAFDDLIEEELAAEISLAIGEEMAEGASELDLDFEDVLGELRTSVEAAVDFMQSQMFPRWERAQEFYDGDTDIKKTPNRSAATKTVVRDAIRALKPNIMRVFTQYPEIVAYKAENPLNFAMSAVAQGQTSYVNQLFWQSGGYLALSNAAHNTLLKKSGILKAHFSEVFKDEYVVLTSVPPDQLEALGQMPDVVVVDVQETEEMSPPDEMGVVTPLLRVEVAVRSQSGKIALEDVLLHEFFVDEAATTPHDAEVIGQRRSVTVGYARSIGLDYEDWLELDDYDIEMNEAAAEGAARKGHIKTGSGVQDSVDESKHKFLLTEAYASFDLDGTGIPQLYRWWLGGTSYEYIAHERVEDNPYGVVNADPIPGSFFGSSIPELLEEDQNTQTSLLRATIDNAHLSNNRRLAFHDTLVNQQDVMNPALGAPIRFRQPGMIQEIGTESTLGTMLPLLQYMEENAQNKVGVTNASMGLDPDALQSTDKDAVRNTIQLAQGQVELICRNMAETGLRDVFTKLLKLSLRHKPREQVVVTGGIALPVDQAVFNPEMQMEVAVGMGTGDLQSRIVAVQAIAAKQEEVIKQYGMANPICGLNHMLNAIVDLGSMMGVPNMGRYFNQVTPEVIQQLDEMARAAAAAQQQEPPSAAIALAEQIRGQAKLADRELELAWEREKHEQQLARDTVKLLTDDDLARDKMAQDLAVEQARLVSKAVDSTSVAAEQDKSREYDFKKSVLTQMMKALEAEHSRQSSNRAVTGQQP